MTTTPNHRASLLAGLRTGGVRSTSASIPHTAAPGASFNVPRFASQTHQKIFPDEDEDQVVELPSHNVFASNHTNGGRAMPMTAAVDGPNNRFSQQQRGMNPNSIPFSPGFMLGQNAQVSQAQVQNQAIQMQMMQLEIMKLQALQVQQYQAEVLAAAQRQQQQNQAQAQNKRASLVFNPPATAGPGTTGFDLRSATLSAQMRRAQQAELGKSQLGDNQLPMTAALGGRFGARAPPSNNNGPMRFNTDDGDDAPAPSTPNTTTVISGGTSLGSPAPTQLSFSPISKSDSATSWRRGSKGNSVLNGANRSFASPSVKITPPPLERRTPSPPSGDATTPNTATPTTAIPKFRPQPLRFSAVVSDPIAVAIDNDANDVDDSSSSSSKSNSNSSPTTPRSSSSNEMPLSPREAASKKLYEGLGIERSTSALSIEEQMNGHNDSYQLPASVMVNHRVVSQPMRQPRGPPSALEELGPKNFATRIRMKAIGGLGMLIGARERRELVEAF